jgi:hypothetical protein
MIKSKGRIFAFFAVVLSFIADIRDRQKNTGLRATGGRWRFLYRARGANIEKRDPFDTTELTAM